MDRFLVFFQRYTLTKGDYNKQNSSAENPPNPYHELMGDKTTSREISYTKADNAFSGADGNFKEKLAEGGSPGEVNGMHIAGEGAEGVASVEEQLEPSFIPAGIEYLVEDVLDCLRPGMFR